MTLIIMQLNPNTNNLVESSEKPQRDQHLFGERREKTIKTHRKSDFGENSNHK
jgi:hypothetical protein